MIEYQAVNWQQALNELEALTDVLQGCVSAGASVGFIDPDDRQIMRNFWQDTFDGLERGDRVLLVHPAARRQGIARQLMALAEQRVKQEGRSLMVLDTRSGDIASLLYLSLGWEIAGAIPYYAQSTEGAMDATTVMYKRLA